jgi:hypothetical protein
MAKKLGIFVSSNQHLPQLVSLCRAAKRKGVDVDIFFTHLGCSMMQDSAFKELAGYTGRMALCLVCYKEHKGIFPIPGIDESGQATQERHCEILEDCDQYLNF